MGYQLGHEHGEYVLFCGRLAIRFHNCGSDSSHQACGEVAFYTPSTDATGSTRRVGSQRRRVRCVHPSLNGDVGNCTDTLVSGTSCVRVPPRVCAAGRDACTDRVLTQELHVHEGFRMVMD